MIDLINPDEFKRTSDETFFLANNVKLGSLTEVLQFIENVSSDTYNTFKCKYHDWEVLDKNVTIEDGATIIGNEGGGVVIRDTATATINGGTITSGSTGVYSSGTNSKTVKSFLSSVAETYPLGLFKSK